MPERFSYQIENPTGGKLFFRLTPWEPPLPPITSVLLGDSTVADLAVNFGSYNGWGQGMYGYFRPSVRIVNLAVPCYSTKIFLASIEKSHMLAIRPEFVLVQLGLIDAFGCRGMRRMPGRRRSTSIPTI